MTDSINSGQDIIDSREIIDRIAELESEENDLLDAVDEATNAVNEYDTDDDSTDDRDLIDAQEKAQEALDDWQSDYGDELKALKELAKEASGYSEDWRHGATLIRDSYFATHAEELANDIGGIDSNAGWPLNHLDWEAAAEELKSDYTSVEFDGVVYWVR